MDWGGRVRLEGGGDACSTAPFAGEGTAMSSGIYTKTVFPLQYLEDDRVQVVGAIRADLLRERHFELFSLGGGVDPTETEPTFPLM